jgi:hypothetical protein
MKSRHFPWRVLLTVALLLGAGWVVLQLARNHDPWKDSACTVRPWSPRTQLLAPTNPPPFRLDTNALPTVTVATNGQQTTVTLTCQSNPPRKVPQLPWQVLEADEQFRVHEDMGSVTFEYLGVGWGHSSETNTRPTAFQVAGRFFRPDLSPFTPADFARFKVSEQDRKLWCRNNFPTLVLELGLTGSTNLALVGVQAFDARTQAPVSFGGDREEIRGARYRIEIPLALWHDTSLELVLDFMVGPAQVFDFPARPGTRQTFPDGMVELVAVAKGSARSQSFHLTSSRDTITLQFDCSPAKSLVSAVFFCQPPLDPAPFWLELLDTQGRKIQSWGASNLGKCILKTAFVSRTKLARVRLRYFPHHYRMLFRLAGLPGLPPENAAVTNLLKVRVPFAHFSNSHELSLWLERMLQVQMTQQQYPKPAPGTFPLSFTNATVGEILTAHLKLHPPGTVVRFDPERGTLDLGPSRLYELFKQVKKWFR